MTISTMSAPQTLSAASARLNVWLRNYIYYSTLVYVFSLRLVTGAGTGLGTRPIELNILLVCLLVKFTRIPRWILWFVLYLTVSSIVGLIAGTSALPWTFIEYRAIVLNVLYYYFFFKLIREDSDRAFLTYTRFAFWFAVIAIPLWMFSISFSEDTRLHGLATEPAQFCALILPAYYWYAHQFLTRRKHLLEVLVFTFTLALSASSLGYICVAFGIVLMLSRRKSYLLVAPVIVGLLLTMAYIGSPYVRLRVDSAVFVATTEDLTGAQASNYSLISNAIITQQVLKENPLFGDGLGSHPVSHQRFLNYIPGVEFFTALRMQNMNAHEAASLTLRVLSEFGILGYLGVLAFVVHFYVGGKGDRAAICNGILVCFFLKLVRSGEYYQPEQFFFIFIYMLNYLRSKNGIPCHNPHLSRRAPWLKLKHSSMRQQPGPAQQVSFQGSASSAEH